MIYLFTVVFVSALSVLYFQYRDMTAAKVSAFGVYRGYSMAIYDGTHRTSEYLRLSDGTRLAYDLILPTTNGVPTKQPLPTLFKYTPYGRAWTVFDEDGNNNLAALMDIGWKEMALLRVRSWLKGNVMDAVSRTEWLGDLVRSGYAVVVVDRPGTGASFGQLYLEPAVAAREANEIVNWIAAQAWSDGNIGMFGDSIAAQIQFQAASTSNPHLKAILPATTWMDNYSAVMFPGGVLNTAMASFYIRANKAFDTLATPVDQDTDRSLLAQARAERHGAVSLAEGVSGVASVPFRDSHLPSGENLWIDQHTLYPLLEQINRSGTPIYLINGWYDIYARDNFQIYANLTVPKRLLVRPTDHAGIEKPGSDLDYKAEAHRWFDYWLKGIDNGIMAEPPVHYYLQGVDQPAAWRSTDMWPPAHQPMTRYYFGPDKNGGKASINNRALTLVTPTAPEAADRYTVDYTTTTGKRAHWSALAEPHAYPNMRANDAKALTYTTPPLGAPLQVVGHPVAHIWLRSDAPDLDVFVYLEAVDRSDNSTYVTQGNLRASHRALAQAPFDNLGLPWHNHFHTELQPLPGGQPVELVFDLLPTAYRFATGTKIRVTIACADSDNFATPVVRPAPTLELLRNSRHASYIDIPLSRS